MTGRVGPLTGDFRYLGWRKIGQERENRIVLLVRGTAVIISPECGVEKIKGRPTVFSGDDENPKEFHALFVLREKNEKALGKKCINRNRNLTVWKELPQGKVKKSR